MLSAKAPGAVTWETGEVVEIQIAQAMLLLHKSDVEIMAMNPRMVSIALQVHAANQEIQAYHIERKQRTRKPKSK